MHRLVGARVYLDANAFIYFGEGHPELGAPVRAIFKRASDHNLALFTSELTLAEVLVMPIRMQREELVAGYLDLLRIGPQLAVLPITRPILIESARRRAATGSKMPDSIHVATAMAAGCTVLVSEDRGIRTPDGLQLIRISELGSASVAQNQQ